MFSRDSKAGRGVGNLYSGEKRKGGGKLQGGAEGSCWPGEAGGGPTRSQASHVIGLRFNWLPRVGRELKIGLKVRKARSPCRVLILLGQLLYSCGLASCTGCCRLWARVPWSYTVRPLYVCILSLSQGRMW